jgi:hypothetical protein
MPIPEPLITRLNLENSEKIRKIADQTNKPIVDIVNTIIAAVQLYDDTTTIIFDKNAQIVSSNNGPKLRLRRTITFKSKF